MFTGRWCGGMRRQVLAVKPDSPAVGVSNPASIRISVVLPQPDGPEQGEELALMNGQVHTVHGPKTAEALHDIIEADQWLGGSVEPRRETAPPAGRRYRLTHWSGAPRRACPRAPWVAGSPARPSS